MKVDLGKCNPGDKLVRRDGYIMTYAFKSEEGRHILRYHDGAESDWSTDGSHDRTKPCCELDADIVGIKSRKHDNNKKTAKCFVEKQSFIDYELVVLFASFRWVGYYASKRNAIRGAKRFCATIGFKCEIVNEESNV